jgi:hypothetical protein
MVRRKNRRLLVAVTYAALLALILVVTVLLPWDRALHSPGLLLLLCVFASRGVFGSLVKNTLHTRRWGETISLGLAPTQHREDGEPDERELAVRNAAYFEAYRVLALYSFLLVVFALSGSSAATVLPQLAMPLLVLAYTLPQAVVLWTEPDVPEEARV